MLISSPAFGRTLLHSETSAPLLSHFRVDFGNEGLFSVGFRNYFLNLRKAKFLELHLKEVLPLTLKVSINII